MSNFDRTRAIFDAAEALPLAERMAFLDAECAGDEQLRSEVESLLGAREQMGEFMEPSVSGWAGVKIGSYQVESVIAEGGMGVVLRAQQQQPRRSVAIKVIRGPIFGAKMLQRFELEAEVLGRLDHPGIARIYEAGTFDHEGTRRPYFVMELIDGAPVTGYVESQHAPLRDRIEILVSICEAVHHAHLRGVIHRDLKPSNILVRSDGQPKVLDFGVARITDSDVQLTTLHTDVGQILGTLPYMSPEQVQGQNERLDLRSDVYALGVVLFEVLTGRLPQSLKGMELIEAARIVSEERPDTLSGKGRRFPSELETIVDKCLRKEPERRYESAAELAQDLQRFLRDEPIAARPTSATYHLRKFARRNRGVVAATLTTLLVLIAGLTLSIMGWRTASRERARATSSAEEANEVSAFLVEMLASADPFFEGGSDVKVVDVLDHAAQRTTESFEDRPELASRVHGVLGDTYRGLGMHDRAAQQTELALERAEAAASDESDPHLVGPLVNLANIRLDEGRLDAADSLGSRASTASTNLSMDSPHRFRLALLRATLAETRGDYEESIRILESSIVAAKAHLSPDHESALDLELLLGNVLWQAGELERAQVVLESGVATLTRQIGADHPVTLSVLNNLSMVYRELEQYETAKETLERILAIKQRMLGPDHRSTAIGHHNLAGVLSAMGRPDEAIPHHETAIDIETRAGTSEVGVAITRSAYGLSLAAAGRLAEALDAMQSAYAVLAPALGADHPRVQSLAGSIADVHDRMGDRETSAKWSALASTVAP